MHHSKIEIPTGKLETEARELGNDEHFDLAQQLETLREEAPYNPPSAIYWWKLENDWEDKASDYFERHKVRLLEEARELHAPASVDRSTFGMVAA